MTKFINRKYKHIIHNRSINRIILRLQRKGTKFYPVYDIIIIKKKKRSYGRALLKLGVFNPNFTDKFLFIDSFKLYCWLQKGLLVHKNIKRYLVKFLQPKVV